MAVRAQAVGCLGPTRFLDAPSKIFSTIRPGKFLTTFFSRSRKNISNSSPKIFDDLSQLSNLAKIRSLDALRSPPTSCPVTTFFSSFFSFTYTFLRKLAPWIPPRVDAQGRRTVRTPSERHCPMYICSEL